MTDPVSDVETLAVSARLRACWAVIDVTSKDLACNQGGETGTSLVVDANAGQPVTFTMNRVRFMLLCEQSCEC